MTKKKIMLVDDSHYIVKIIGMVLESEGFEIITTYSGKECLNKLKEKPDLILLDILMPEMSGTDVLKTVMKKDPKAKVVMLSVMGQEPIMTECKRLGAKDFIMKPFDNVDLVRRVKKVIGE